MQVISCLHFRDGADRSRHWRHRRRGRSRGRRGSRCARWLDRRRRHHCWRVRRRWWWRHCLLWRRCAWWRRRQGRRWYSADTGSGSPTDIGGTGKKFLTRYRFPQHSLDHSRRGSSRRAIFNSWASDTMRGAGGGCRMLIGFSSRLPREVQLALAGKGLAAGHLEAKLIGDAAHTRQRRFLVCRCARACR